ncbi:MAG: cupin domain-containing protein, partial [Oleiphilaceae bacterium]|nr:cupin domain-containing protein [Oleiphilaceae bacterium]
GSFRSAGNPDRRHFHMHRNVLRPNSVPSTSRSYFYKNGPVIYNVNLPAHSVSMAFECLDPLHSSTQNLKSREAIVFVQRGYGKCHINGMDIDWSPGDAMYLPAWSSVKLVNTSEEEAAVYMICTGAGEGLFMLPEFTPCREADE